ncbi:TonB-dependent receptor plug domain-containing protein [Janthinobacterium sp. P210005]|uniref:TonB-dependent receptor plug domain-containing protein n=1 Tax=Janthinobacterium sp. P210005 TaxID=3112938 RepID=UPI002E257F7F|nr:TonB-dependent receptor [Janthinobacterium sp. P210005]
MLEPIHKHDPAPRLRQLAHAVSVAVLLLGAPGVLHAQAAPDGAGALAAAPYDTVIVTGARGTGRTVANSAAPIDVISAQQLQATGKLNLLDALDTALPSFNLPARVQPDLGSIVRAGQLRNLDPSHTLVLVNGKRRHTTAIVNEDGFPGSVATDLALIPTGAIARVEILRDGASAIYGSDAIAGVINIILKADDKGSFSTQLGSTYDGDGTNGSVRIDGGTRLGEHGFAHFGAEVQRQGIAVRNFGLNPGYLSYPAVRNSDGQLVKLGPNNSLPAGASPNPAEASRNSNPWRNTGVPQSTTASLSANFGYDVSNEVQLYGFGTYAHRNARSAQNFRLPNTIFNNNKGLLSVYPDGFTPYETTSENDFSLTGGVKGETAGWNWDISSTYGRDDIDVGVENSANYSLSYPGGKTDFTIGNQRYSRSTTNADARRPVPLGLSEPADLSVGLEYSHETQQRSPGEPASWQGSGSSALAGYLPVDASDTARHSYAAYVGLGAKLTPQLLLDTALRAEKYSDFGSKTTGRLSARYDVTPTVAVRGTVSNGFHAPSLVTQSYSNTSDHAGVPYTLAQPNSAAARALGAQALKPEKSTNLSAGLTFNPTPTLRLAVDAYQIKASDRLGVSSNIGIDRSSGVALDGSGRPLTAAQASVIENLLRSAGLTVGNGLVAHYFANVGDTRTRGIDLTAEDVLRVADGKLRWTAAANINHTSLVGKAALPTVLQGLPNIGTLSKSAEYDLLYRAPRDKEILALAYEKAGWTFNVRETRYGKLKRLNAITGGDYQLKAAFVTDVSVGYDISKRINVTVGANNVFDQKPGQVPRDARSAANLAQYTGTYDNSGPLGVLGGYYYARATVHF